MEGIEIIDESTDHSNALLSSLRRVVMASIGAFVLVPDEVEDFLDKLVDRGEIADADARKLINDMRDGRVRVVQDNSNRAEGEMDRRVESVLSRLNIPTKSDIDNLSARVSELNDKVDELNNIRRGQ